MSTTADGLVAELTREAATTRRVLERVPETRLSWKPHPKSMSLGTLALHVARLPGAITGLIRELQVEVPVVPLPEARSRSEILSTFDESVATARTGFSGWTDEDLAAEWRLTQNGRTLIALPRVGVVRSIMFNHSYHHRGQLTVYLRLLDVAVPSVYGPSADESPFA